MTKDSNPKDANKDGVEAASPKGSIYQATLGLTLNSSYNHFNPVSIFIRKES